MRRTFVVGFLAVLLAACSPAVPAPAPTPPPTVPAEPTELVVGVEDLGSGFNPHLVSHVSPLSTAVAALVLPSVFRPTPEGVLELDPTIATSAEVVSDEPFTVSYELALEASWSTNTPIAAEDFVFLWEQMRVDPAAVDAGGYRLITEVRSRAGGKAVDVVFAEPYPAWRTLFAHLLPAHLLKDAPGQWSGATLDGLPASGGPFRLASVDVARGEVVLARNDTYWDTPAVLDTLVLRRLDDAAMAAGLAAGDVDIALPEADPAVRTAIGGITPAPRVQPAPLPTVTQLALRADAGPLADVRARRGLAALVDRDAIRQAVAPEALPAGAFALAPSQPGYASTAPEGAPALPDPAVAEQELVAAGWARDSEGVWTIDGAAVELTIGAADDRPEDRRVAQLVAAQLGVAGIDATVVELPAAQLFVDPVLSAAQLPSAVPTTTTAPTTTPPTPSPLIPPPPEEPDRVDVVVGLRTAGGDPGTQLASDFGCASPTELVPDPPRPPSGFCDPLLQDVLESTAAGGQPGDAARLAAAEQLLWRQLPVLPLFQPVSLVVSTPAADAATGVGPGALTTGPLADAALWRQPER